MNLLNWFRRARLEYDLDRELQYHFDRRVSDLMEEGLPESEARRRATLEIGGLAQERVDRHPAALQVLLQLGAPRTDFVGALQRVHAL